MADNYHMNDKFAYKWIGTVYIVDCVICEIFP